MSYEHLMGTADEGSYLGPSRVLINRRRLRQGPKGTLEYISQVGRRLVSWRALSRRCWLGERR